MGYVNFVTLKILPLFCEGCIFVKDAHLALCKTIPEKTFSHDSAFSEFVVRHNTFSNIWNV